MGGLRFALVAEVSTDDPPKLLPVLERLVGAEFITRAPGGFRVACVLEGETAKELNRQLLSELRRTVKRTRLQAEWTAVGVTERFFDYVAKGTGPDAP